MPTASGSGFQFRGACEPCHRRKIRCIIPPGESACSTCTHSGIACLFAPRRKPGRPKRVEPGRDTRLGSPTSVDHSGESSVPDFGGAMMGIDADVAMDAFWNNLSSGDESYGPNSWAEPSTLQQMQLNQSNSQNQSQSHSHPDESTFGSVPDALQYPTPSTATFPTHGMPDTDGTMPLSRSHSQSQMQSKSLPSFGFANNMHDGSGPPSVPSSGLDDNAAVGFESTMQLCRDLHEYRQRVSRRPSFAPSVHHNVFHDLLRMCTAATSMPPAAGYCPATALVSTAMLKFLELCSAIIARLLDSPPAMTGAAHLETMFLLKKMDLVLLPTKLFLSEKGHHAGVQRAQELHHQIEATLMKEYPQLAWGDVPHRHSQMPCGGCATFGEAPHSGT